MSDQPASDPVTVWLPSPIETGASAVPAAVEPVVGAVPKPAESEVAPAKARTKAAKTAITESGMAADVKTVDAPDEVRPLWSAMFVVGAEPEGVFERSYTPWGDAITTATDDDRLRFAVTCANVARNWKRSMCIGQLGHAFGGSEAATRAFVSAGRILDRYPQIPLMLHFDLNGTVIRGDLKGGQKDPRAADSDIMARSVYGTHDSAGWHLNATTPFRCRPGQITYYKYLDRIHGNDRETVYKLAAEFIDGPGQGLRHVFNAMRKTRPDQLALSFRIAMALFLPVSVVLFRTFGADGDLLAAALQESKLVSAERPCLRWTALPATDSEPRRLVDDESGTEYTFDEFNSVVKDPAYRGRIILVQENHAHWAAAKKNPACGKYAKSHKDWCQVVIDDLLPECWTTEGSRVATHHANPVLINMKSAYVVEVIVDALSQAFGCALK